MYRHLRYALVALWGAGLWPAAALGAPSAKAGTPVGEDDAVQRRAIRGMPVESTHESEQLRALREFDEASFPKSIGHDDDDERPDADALRSPGAPQEQPAGTSIPWLSSLRMPDMSARLDPRVLRYLEFYKSDPKGRAIMRSWLVRQGRYRALMESAITAARLPLSLLYVSMIESSYDPHDRSHAGAVGLWQFLPEGARIYGLRVDHWVDERKDPDKATTAAMRYLGDLKTRFGSWPLALAAFNAGYGAVLRSMHKYNSNDYWELCRHENGLPWETTLYVPKVMATAIVGENRALFGFDDVVTDPSLSWERVFVDSSMSYAAIATAAGVSDSVIATLNPHLRRGRTPPGESRFEVHVPRGTAQRFLGAYEKSKESVRAYALRFGERLDDVARSLSMSTKALKQMNGLADSTEVEPGMLLVVPSNKEPTPAPPCATVVVAVPDKDSVVSGKKRVFYRTLPTDTLGDVASFFGVRAADLQRWNNLDADARLVGNLVLQVWVNNDLDTGKAALIDATRVRVVTVGSDEFFELEEAKRGRVRLTYVVKAGEDLKHIGKKFGLTPADMERINRFGEKHSALTVGQKLVVYRAMSATEKKAAMCKLVPGGTDSGAVSTKGEAPDDETLDEEPPKLRGADAASEVPEPVNDAAPVNPQALPRPPVP